MWDCTTCTDFVICVLILGDYCETKIPFCTKEYNPCQNGAKCVDQFTHYKCECAPGFKGDNCTLNIDDCENHMCQVRSPRMQENLS